MISFGCSFSLFDLLTYSHTQILFIKCIKTSNKTMTSADHASQESTTLLPMSANSSSPTWRSNKLLWAALAAAGVALSVAIFRSTSIPFSQNYENPAARGYNYHENEPKVLVAELEGSKHHKAKDVDNLSVCEDGGYSKRT
jgi:hypothetical protein